MAKKKVCILVRNDLERDPRILRQVRWLAEAGSYDLTVVGFGPAGMQLTGADQTIAFGRPIKTLWENISLAIRLLLCNFSASLAEKVYWDTPIVKEMYQAICGEHYDIIHANDWDTLPIALKCAQLSKDTRVVYDSHELAVAEFDDELWFRFFHKSFRKSIERRYIAGADKIVTVSTSIAQRLRQMYKVMDPVVIMNCPDWQWTSVNEVDFVDVKLCYHGKYGRDRGIEELINAVGILDECYSLHMYIVTSDPEVLIQLQTLAQSVAPGRVIFHDPVGSTEIVEAISKYDIGIYAIKPTNFNNLAALPNKFFEFIMAGLCLCIAPLPEMRSMIEKYGCGIVAAGYDAKSLAESVKSLSAKDILRYKKQALKAAEVLNSKEEGKKMLGVYREII